jgi:glycosyltransferase involved in cell wall biosynthesis
MELAAGLARLLASDEARRDKGAYARRHVQHYDWDIVARRFASIYDR